MIRQALHISRPKVSILLATYNRAHLLSAVIQSILSQDYEDFELVVVDDGSTDHTAEVISKIQRVDHRVRYIVLPTKQGLGTVRKVGIYHGCGRYLAFADSDDIWIQGKLQVQVDILEKYKEIDILFGDFLNINHLQNTTYPAFKFSPSFRKIKTRKLENGVYLILGGLEEAILKSNFIAMPTLILRKEILRRVGGFREIQAVDLEFCWRAALLGAKYAYLDKPLIERHIYGDSMTAQGPRPWIDRLEAMRIMYEYCRRSKRYSMLRHIRVSWVKTYHNLLRQYGMAKNRAMLFPTLVASLKIRFSLKTMLWYFAGMLGPTFITKIVKRSKR